MAEDLKEKIYEFLKESSPEKFNMSKIKEKTKISYPSVLKWIEVLAAEIDRDPPLHLEDYGNIKLAWVGIE